MIYYKSTIEEANEKALARIKDYRRIASFAPAVIDVVKAFDGKVYSVRFERAIEAATDRAIYARKEYNHHLHIYGFHEYEGCGYGNVIDLCYFPLAELKEGKRIPADKIIEEINRAKESLLDRAHKIEENMPKMAETRETVKKAINELEEHLCSFPSDIQELYDIPRSIRVY